VPWDSAQRAPRPLPQPRPRAPAASLTLDAVNDAALTRPVGPKAKGPAVLRAQVLLDRARFSPGEIDASFGSNMQKAIAAYQKENGLNPSGSVDGPTSAGAEHRRRAGSGDL
jgi:peptidoglycan hydrolase-like protein with peptidoglycan-binding domain